MVKMWFILEYCKWDQNGAKMSELHHFLFPLIIFIQKESLTSKKSPSLQNSLQHIFVIFATNPWFFWLKAVPPSLEAVLKAIQAFMSSIRSGISKLKKLDSLQLSLQAYFDLI